MPIAIMSFTGEVPRVNKRLLPDTAAQIARNCRLESGPLEPIAEEVLAHTFDSPVTSFTRHNGTWVGFDANVDVTPGPISEDRLYYTGDGAPKIMIGSTSRDMALPAPDTAPTIVLGASVGAEDQAETTVYAYTCVTDLGEESAPSPLTDAVEVEPGQDVTLSGLTESVAGRGIDTFRIYRSQTSTTGTTDLYYATEIDATSTEITLTNGDIGEAIPTLDYSTPPDTMEGIIALPNGILAAHDGRDLLFSEPYVPYAWPEKYRLKTDYPIVGLCAFGTNIAIMTTGMPYRAQGSHPDSMQMDQVEQLLPCLSARGIVDLGYAGAYPSSDGLITITASGAQNVTENLFTRKQWSTMNPSSFIASSTNGKYVFSYLPLGEADRRIGIIDLTGKEPFFIRSDTIADDVFFDVTTGDMFILSGDTNLYLWDDPFAYKNQYEWKSKVFTTPSPVNFGAIRVEGIDTYDETGPFSAVNHAAVYAPDFSADFVEDEFFVINDLTFSAEVYADGVLRHTIDSLNVSHRLPGGFLAEQWEIRITGSSTVERVVLAETLSDLGQVA